MNVEFVKPFIDATLNVLRTMAQIDAMPGKVSLKNSRRSIGDMTGIIGLAGKEVKGSFAISFSESCIRARGLHSNMLGEEINELSGDIMDAVGELTNMISGGAKAELDERGIFF